MTCEFCNGRYLYCFMHYTGTPAIPDVPKMELEITIKPGVR